MDAGTDAHIAVHMMQTGRKLFHCTHLVQLFSLYLLLNGDFLSQSQRVLKSPVSCTYSPAATEMAAGGFAMGCGALLDAGVPMNIVIQQRG